MKLITGKVIDGRVEIPLGLAEGSGVAILVSDAEGFRLSWEQESELSGALAKIQSGKFETVTSWLAEPYRCAAILNRALQLLGPRTSKRDVYRMIGR